ncbi:MAG: hypothetical protein Fur005_43400 [Roseiflexaceae bacterium]
MIAAHQAIAEQSAYLRKLHETSLQFLNHHTLPELFQDTIERAIAILDAPYTELHIYDGTRLTRQAHSADGVEYVPAHLPNQVLAVGLPIAFANDRQYHEATLGAVAGFPIMAGNAALGVLVLGRPSAAQPFSAEQVQRGQLFTQMIGLIIECVRLYDQALNEIAVRTEAEQTLRMQAQQLRLQNAELDAFAHTVAHDLAAPLTGIVGYSELMKMAIARGSLHEIPNACNTIIRIGKKMAQIINGMLLLARVRKQSDIPKSVLSMDVIISEVEMRLAHKITEKQAVIVRPAAWPEVYSYAPWIEEVWANYLDNALKYGGQPPHITLMVDHDLPGFVRFWVCDNGPGLSVEQQAQMFNSITRFHMAQADGHGLGLSIVARIISRLGGDVGVESAVRQGHASSSHYQSRILVGHVSWWSEGSLSDPQ